MPIYFCSIQKAVFEYSVCAHQLCLVRTLSKGDKMCVLHFRTEIESVTNCFSNKEGNRHVLYYTPFEIYFFFLSHNSFYKVTV